MRTQWSEQQSALRSRFAAFGLTVAARAEACRTARQLDFPSWQQLAEEGFFGLPVPKAQGGAGLGWWEFAAALEGLSSTAGDFGFLLSIIAHMGAIRAILRDGSERQRSEILPLLIGGDLAATATTEPGGGSDVARVQTAAAAGADGTLRLAGRKAHITNAPIAQVFLVLGRIPSLGPKKDLTLFLLERGSPGLSTEEAEVTIGNLTSPTGSIRLDDVPVDPAQILGRPGDGLALLYGMLTLDRLLYALVAAGYLEALVKQALVHAEGRSSFGKPLAENQYIQDKIVLMKVGMEQARLLSYAALDHMLTDHPQALLMGSIAKLAGTEQLWQSAYEFVQLHGHLGYMEGPVSHVLCDTVAARIAGGTSEMQKINIFKQLQKLAAAAPVSQRQEQMA